MSADRLCRAIIEKQNPTVFGLDPLLDYIPEFIKDKYSEMEDGFEAAAAAVLHFNKQLIDATHDIIPAVKPQAAYYELYGWQGMRAYRETIEYAKSKGLYVIADVKRGDIGSTSLAYANAYLGETQLKDGCESAFPADACTVSPYLGSDGITPFLEVCAKNDAMIFLLVKTSNPSSSELQDLAADGELVYERVADLTDRIGGERGSYGYCACGAVVGATYPKQLEALRKRTPGVFFLVPGFGAQGAGAADVAKAFDQRGLGAVINSSRALMCAWQKSAWQKKNSPEEDFALAAREEALKMKAELLEAIGGKIG